VETISAAGFVVGKYRVNVAAPRQSAADCARIQMAAFSRKPLHRNERGVLARRTKLGEDGNLMQADGNSFPASSLGWTIGGSASCPNSQRMAGG